MRSTRQLSITLPHGMAEMVRGKVEAGDYASESEVVREGLRALQARDRALEQWLRGEVMAAYEAIAADPARGLSVEDVKTSLEREDERDTSART